MEGGVWRMTAKGGRVSLGGMKCPAIDCDDGCTAS